MSWVQRLAGAAIGTAIVCVPAAALAQTNAPTGISRQNSQDDSFTLNLKNADITTLIATVSEVTGRNFVVDPRVKGQVTVLSNQPMTPAELYQTFLSVLDVHGFAAVPSGEVIKIIPQINAKQDGGFGHSGGATNEDVVTKVLHVNNVPADQLVPILRPLVPQYGHLAAYAASNSLVISDREANVARLTKIVRRIDSNGSSSVDQVHLSNANASDVADAIQKLEGNNKKNASSSVVALDRTNSVLISGTAEQRRKLRRIIHNMDTKSQESGDTAVIYLNYADAETLAPVLQAYATGQSYSSGNSRNRGLSNIGNSSGFGSNNGNNSGSFGSSSPINRGSSNSGGGSVQGISGSKDSDVAVIAEAGANALIIHAPADKMGKIKHIISKLDIRRGQVLVEGIIAEIGIQQSKKLGINIAALKNGGPAAASILNSETLSAVGQAAANGTPLNLIQQGLNVALGSTNGEVNFALLVNALSNNVDTNVLSTPSLITRDNEEAQIKVGQKVPFVTGSYTSGTSGVGNGNNPFQTIDREDVGLQLAFIPQISAGNTIQLTIDEEVSSIAPSAQQTTSAGLITNSRTLQTAVEVQNGQILVLGGLIDNNVQVTHNQVPVLGDIPILGSLFRYNAVDRNKRNLLNFIRPTILRGDGESNRYSAAKYKYLRNLQMQQSKKRLPLMKQNMRPQLPPMDRFSGGTHTGPQSDTKGSSSSGKRRGDQFSD
ncbi:type II secretion system secretin GspD [Salinisphaera hydrothermalis]|uniref:General secretion pathway protein D n=1 Tax=Salinisphaera hydrothermalis (strain C41B8) TaxID=1304275 RepID=A0A084IQP0_SALHC|nr:type II secretion system secretin GspD [Salinisphaera hydrothermalis]KEZ79024.1 general secretion pathway protein D [Salinisphaera hydrothermalis C41B8]